MDEKLNVAHQPVMVDEVMKYLITEPEGIYVDGTVGTGGHSLHICGGLAPRGMLIGLDVDKSSIGLAKNRLSRFSNRVRLIRESYVKLDRVIRDLGVEEVNGIFLDLGLSSYQLESPGRGFSFGKDEPLDMRMDLDGEVTAMDLLSNLSSVDLQKIFREYAQERWAGPIARAIVEERQKATVSSTGQLARIVESVIPSKYHPRKIHPATRTFQALRIAVNKELKNIAAFLKKAPGMLIKGGRLVVIYYHSLEGRLVKQALRSWERKNSSPRRLPVLQDKSLPVMRDLTRKGIKPSQAEVDINPRARSAVMRVAERV